MTHLRDFAVVVVIVLAIVLFIMLLMIKDDELRDRQKTLREFMPGPTVPQPGYRHHRTRKEAPVTASQPEPVEPQRSRDGYWTHPHYFTPAGDRDTEGPGEFNAWLTEYTLDCSIRWMREEVQPELIRTYLLDNGNVSRWQPIPPPGNGWFIGSLHDTQQGAVCIWLRRRAASGNKPTATGAAF